MRRAFLQIFPATPSGASWLGQLGAASCQQGVLRSCGEVSTSYSGVVEVVQIPVATRGFAAKGGAKGKAAAAPPPPSAPKPPQPIVTLTSAGARLRRRRPDPDPLTLLTAQQRQLAELLAHRPPPPSAAAAVGSQSPVDAAAVADPLPPTAESQLQGLGQLGLPLGPAEVSLLLHQSLSQAVGQNVQFQPFVFSNIFQSASAAAAYVAAALEGGSNWGKVERFFLAAVEVDSIVRGVRVAVAGRMGLKSDMAATKVWEWGEMSLRAFSDRLDYGAATANTRLGALGVKVWIRYKTGAVKDVFFPPMGGSHYRAPPAAGAKPTMSLDELYEAAVTRTARLDLPYKFSSVGWWERPATEQPPENRVSELFVREYDPVVGDRLDQFLRRQREERRRFRSVAERRSYMATTGRFLAKQRRLAPLRTGRGEPSQLRRRAAAGEVGEAVLGRRPNRVLALYPLDAFARKGRTSLMPRLRMKEGKHPMASGSAKAD